MELMKNIGINLIADVVLILIIWTVNKLIKTFSEYQIVVVKKSTYQAFKKATPNLDIMLRTGTYPKKDKT